METKSLVTLFWEEMGLLMVLVVPILIMLSLLGHRMGHLIENRFHRPRHS